MVEQIDLFEYERQEETLKLVDNRLTTQQHSILSYLKLNALGEIKVKSAKHLANLFKLKERELRKEITAIRKHKPSHVIIASNSKGYYIPLENEREKGNRMLLERWEGATETLLGNDPRLISFMFWKLNQLKDTLDTPLQGQTVMQFNGWEKDINYYANKYEKEQSDE